MRGVGEDESLCTCVACILYVLLFNADFPKEFSRQLSPRNASCYRVELFDLPIWACSVLAYFSCVCLDFTIQSVAQTVCSLLTEKTNDFPQERLLERRCKTTGCEEVEETF